MARKVLVLGYGNFDRQDDGVSWHVLEIISHQLKIPITGVGIELSDPIDEHYPVANRQLDNGSMPELQNIDRSSISLEFSLQLMPEMAEEISGYDRLFFVDAHTGDKTEEIQLTQLKTDYQTSSFTHHLTPESLLAISKALYHKSPQGYLLSIHGYEFGFSNELSGKTLELVQIAGDRLISWLINEQSLPVIIPGDDNRQIAE